MAIIEGFLVTNEPIAAYGGVQISDEMLQIVVDRMVDGSMSFGTDHDPRRRHTYSVLQAEVRQTENGYLGAYVRLDVSDDLADEVRERGLTGFSISISQPVAGEENAPIQISADALWFSDDVLREVYTALNRLDAGVEVSRLYQFSLIPEATVVVTFLISQSGPFVVGMASTAAFEGLKWLILHRKSEGKSKFFLQFRNAQGESVVDGFLETDSIDEFERAMNALGRMEYPSGSIEYQSQSDSWVAPK